MKKTKQRYVALKLTSINVYTCILLNATVSGIIFEILTSNDQRSLFGKNILGAFNCPLSKAKVEGGLFFTSFRKLESDTTFVVCGKREMASSFVFQVKNVDSVVMLLRTLNVLTILLLILDLLI